MFIKNFMIKIKAQLWKIFAASCNLHIEPLLIIDVKYDPDPSK